MELSKVRKIIDTFHSKDWSEYYDYHNDPNLKKSIWIRLNRIPEFNFVFDSITEDIKKISQDYILSQDEYRLLIYQVGDFFKPHVDGITYGKSSAGSINNVLSGGYILNDEFKGGEFYLNRKKLETNIGEIFTFGRDEVHEVKPVTEGVRYSIHFAVNSSKTKEII